MKPLLLLLLSATLVSAQSSVYPPSPTAAELIAAARDNSRDITFPSHAANPKGSATKLRKLPKPEPAAKTPEEAMTALEEKPLRKVEEAAELPDDIVAVLKEKPFRGMVKLPAVRTPTRFEINMAFTWEPPKSEFMKTLLKDINHASEVGDTEEYDRLIEKYALWSEYPNKSE